MRFFALLFLLSVFAPVAVAQEFNCSVNLDMSSLSGAQHTYVQDLERQIAEYFNERSWTDDRYMEHERIDCTIQITIEEAVSLSSFRGRLIVASRRPIYGTSQNTTVAQFSDSNWQFNYTQGTSLNFNMEQFDPLTSVLDYYAMLILGYDYDTFEERGGTPYFERARRLAELAQAQNAVGWTDMGSDRSRSDLVRQLLDPRFRALRDAYFRYHFNGLDHFVADADAARSSVIEVLEEMQELFENMSSQYAIDLFFSTKYQELAAVFEGSTLGSQAYDLLAQLDPSHMSDYERLVR